MAFYDDYEDYRPQLTQEDAAALSKAAEEKMLFDARAAQPNSGYVKVPEGYRVEDGVGSILIDPEIKAFMRIAMRHAERQFEGWPTMPESIETLITHPGMDPVGKYSTIDLNAAQRMTRIKAVLESRSPEVSAYVEQLLELSKDGAMAPILSSLTEEAKRHRILTRASKLCLDPMGRKLLHQESRKLEVSETAAQMEQYLTGLEYAVGLKSGPIPEEIRSFFHETLHMPLDYKRIQQAKYPSPAKETIQVDFQNLANKELQIIFADAHNWGRTQQEVMGQTELHMPEGVVTSYARATVSSVLDPIFHEAESLGVGSLINRGDLIVINGQTVREMMQAEYQADGRDLSGFEAHYRKSLMQKTSELVAAALMAEVPVEVYVPGRAGGIGSSPIPLSKAGYTPRQAMDLTPVEKVTLNAWERFFAKHGFYKEKAKKAAEYQDYQKKLAERERMRKAGERVQAQNLKAIAELDNPALASARAQFYNRPLPNLVPAGYSVARSAYNAFAICAMAAKGYPVEDIFDPTKLKLEKLSVGKTVFEMLDTKTPEHQQWIAEASYLGMRRLMDYIDTAAHTVDIFDEKKLFGLEGRTILGAMKAAFDTSQNMIHCSAEYRAAAAKFDGPNADRVLDDRTNTVPAYLDYALQANSVRAKFLNGDLEGTPPETALATVLNYEAIRRAFSEKAAQNPNVPVSKLFCIDQMAPFFNYGNQVNTTPTFQTVLSTIEKGPKPMKAFGESLRTGQAQKQMEIHAHVGANMGVRGTSQATDADVFDFRFELKKPFAQILAEAESKQNTPAAHQSAPVQPGGRTR